MIAIGSDHAGYELKQLIIKHLWTNNIDFEDCGGGEEACDYPDIAKAVCEKVTNNNAEFGILICGTGIGMSMCANKIKGIRAALCTDMYSAKCTRMHNDANVLCLGGRVTGFAVAYEIVDIFLNTEYEGDRHVVRLQKMKDLEEK